MTLVCDVFVFPFFLLMLRNFSFGVLRFRLARTAHDSSEVIVKVTGEEKRVFDINTSRPVGWIIGRDIVKNSAHSEIDECMKFMCAISLKRSSMHHGFTARPAAHFSRVR